MQRGKGKSKRKNYMHSIPENARQILSPTYRHSAVKKKRKKENVLTE